MEKKKALAEVLWASVEALMVEHWGAVNVTKLGRDAKIGGSASRLKARSTSIGIDILEKVAAVFKVAPASLLIQDNEIKLVFSDKDLQRVVRIYAQTDDSGRQTLLTATKIAEEGARAAAATGVGKTRKT